jgi:hypothetical protein
MVSQSDEDRIAEMQAKSRRQVMAEFMLALSQLLLHLDLPADPTDISLNFHGRLMRIDLARLTEDGEHIAEWFVGLNANLASPDFGRAVPLPGTDATAH